MGPPCIRRSAIFDLLQSRQPVTRRLLAAPLLTLLLPLRLLSQTHSAFPVDITATPAAQPVTADGRIHVLYELHLTSFSRAPIEFTGLDVLPDESTEALATYRGAALEKLLFAPGPNVEPDKLRTIGGGRALVVFLDLTLSPGTRPPAEFHHHLLLSTAGKDGTTVANTVNGPSVMVLKEPAPLLHAPLRGSRWLAANGLSNPGHRRSFVPVDGRERIAQRFAIDWVQLGPDGRLFHGDSNLNSSFYAYGADVLAVADGRISGLTDRLPDNPGSNEPASRTITLDNVVGNYLILDLGHGRFALYAHLQPGSLRVKLGDTVKAGQVLAKLGNSGNSDSPHLHFQLMDANSPVASEGMPYELETFTQIGVVTDPDPLDAGKAWLPEKQAPLVVHRKEFPVDGAVVTFP
jgi:hypothetical protein